MKENTFEVISPIDGRVYASRAYSTEAALTSLLDSAVMAQREWVKIPLEQRITICRKFIELLCSDSERLGEELSWMMGRPIRHTTGEFKGVRQRGEYMLGIAADCLADRVRPHSNAESARISHIPAGVVMVIAPWNYPYLTTVNSVIPALVSGNAVILKHSPQTPLVAESMARAFDSAGLPESVFQFAHCSNAQTLALVRDKRTHHVVFTGSVEVGRIIAGAAGQALTGCTLELGGKDAAYVRSDADIEWTAAALADGAFYNAGQSCCAIERVYVAREIYADFLDALLVQTNLWQLGDPLDQQTTLGPVVTQAAANRIRQQLHEAVNAGATLHQGRYPERLDLPGNYLPAQVLTGIDHTMPLMREETFGPVVGVMAVDGDDQAVALMNDSDYGLTSSVWTGDGAAAERIGAQLDTGTWYLNRCDYLSPDLPWSGRKHSGLGCSLSEMGYAGLTRPKSALTLRT